MVSAAIAPRWFTQQLGIAIIVMVTCDEVTLQW